MKKLNYFFFALLTLTFFACDSDTIDDLTETKISTVFEESFNVDINEDDPLSTAISSTINVGDNDDLDGVLSTIEGYEINSVSFTIRDYEGANDIVLESALVSFQVSGGTSVISSIQDLNLSQAETVKQDLAFNSDALNSIASTLLDNQSVTAIVNTTVSGAPVSFRVELEVDVTVTVDPI